MDERPPVDERGSGSETTIRVLVVDDHPVWRDGLRQDLERAGTASVVGEASDGGEAIDMARETMPDVILMDLRMPTVPGVDAIRLIVDDAPHVKILVLSATGEEADVLEAVKVGASGYLLKNEILRLVAKGYSYREIAEKLFISHKTVQNHVQNILTKLQLRKRYELMRYAIHRGLDRAPE